MMMGLDTKETRLRELTAELVRLSEETTRVSREIQQLLGQQEKEFVSPAVVEAEAEETVLSPLVLEFMDQPDLREKYEFLRSMDRTALKDSDVDTMAVVIDVTLSDGSIDDRIEDLMACIRRLLQYQNYRR